VTGLRARKGIFLFASSSRKVLEPTYPPLNLVPGALYPGVKRQKREANLLPPFSFEVKNSWSFNSTPHTIRLREVVLSYAKDTSSWCGTQDQLNLYPRQKILLWKIVAQQWWRADVWTVPAGGASMHFVRQCKINEPRCKL